MYGRVRLGRIYGAQIEVVAGRDLQLAAELVIYCESNGFVIDDDYYLFLDKEYYGNTKWFLLILLIETL